MDVNGSLLNVWIDGLPTIVNADVSGFTRSGHALIGTYSYGHFTQFDNFQLYTEYHHCGASARNPKPGDPIAVVECNSEVGVVGTSTWRFGAIPNNKSSVSTISLYTNPSLCIAAIAAGESDPWWLQLAPCNQSDPLQLWAWWFLGIAPDLERSSYIYLPGSNRCLDIYNQRAHIGAQMDAWPCNLGANQAFWFDFDAGEVGNEATATCLGIC
jgi:hypothetical protein